MTQPAQMTSYECKKGFLKREKVLFTDPSQRSGLKFTDVF